MSGVDAPGLRSDESQGGAVFVRALRDRELRRAAARFAADAIVLARTMEQASARAEKAQRKGRRKVLLVLAAGAGAIGVAVGVRKAVHRS